MPKSTERLRPWLSSERTRKGGEGSWRFRQWLLGGVSWGERSWEKGFFKCVHKVPRLELCVHGTNLKQPSKGFENGDQKASSVKGQTVPILGFVGNIHSASHTPSFLSSFSPPSSLSLSYKYKNQFYLLGDHKNNPQAVVYQPPVQTTTKTPKLASR